MALSAKPGDRVILSNHISPKYLAEASATVVRKDRGKLIVKVDKDFRYRRYSGLEIGLPPGLIGRVE